MTPDRPDTATRWFVRLVTVVCGLAAGWYVHAYGTDLPVRDEWYLLPQWVQSPSTAEWLVALHNEHRYPVGKAVWLGILAATGYNLKAPMYGTVGLLTAAAALLQRTARRARGYAHPVDAAFPLLLTHWGNGFNLLFGYQIGQGVLAFALAGWAWAAGRVAAGGGYGWGAVGGLFAVALAGCGGFGLAYVPAGVVWTGYLGVRAFRERRPVWGAVYVAAAAGLAGYLAWAVATTPLSESRPNANGVVAGTLQYLRLGTGDGHWAWDWADPLAWAVGGLYATGLAAAGWRVWRGNGRPLWLAVGMMLVGTVALGAVIARGRPGVFEWYTTGSAAGLAVAALAVGHRQPGEAGRGRRWWWRTAGAVVFLGAIAIYGANIAPGLWTAELVEPPLRQMQQDIAAGYPATVVGSRTGGAYPVLIADDMIPHLETLRVAGFPQFRTVSPEPPLTPQPVAGLAVPFTLTCSSADLSAGTPPVTPLPDPPPRTYALRLKTWVVDSTGAQRAAVEWTDADSGEGRAAEAYPSWASHNATLIFPLSGRPTGLRLVPRTVIGRVRVDAAEWLVSPP